MAQLPTSLIQFSLYGAGDEVGGTFGTTGGSGINTMLLFLISFYLIVRYASLPNKNGFNVKKLIIISLVLIPCAFNETKIVFILLPLYFIFIVFSVSLKRGIYKIPIIILIAGLFLYYFYYYYSITVRNPLDYLSLDFIKRYLFTYRTTPGNIYISRYAMFPEMFYIFSKDVGAYIFGIGYGIFKGQNILGISQRGASTAYLWQRSQTLLFETWFQGGICFVLILFFAIFLSIRGIKRKYTQRI